MQKNKLFFNLLLSSLFLFFLIFLISIPQLINNEDNFKQDNKILYEGKTQSKFLEESKFNYITNTLIDELTTIKVGNSQNQYLLYLIVENKIINRENTIAQEIISQYLNNNTEIAKKITKEIIESRLPDFDSENDRRWRNEILTLNYKNKTIKLYENENILRSVYDSEIVGITKKQVKLYKTQKYIFTYPNNSIETITIDLETGQSTGDLGEFIDFKDNNKPKVELKNIEIKFETSNDEYQLKFLIWK